MNALPVFTEKTREFCFYAGFAGILFTVISIIHVLIAANTGWFIIVLILPNLSSGVSFFLLIKKSRHSIITLNITLVFFLLYFMMIYYLFTNLVFIFSPSTLLLLFVYVLVIVAYAYITDLPGKLKENYLRLKEDSDYWAGKI